MVSWQANPVRGRSLLRIALIGLLRTAANTAFAAPVDCKNNRCGLLTDGDYKNYVIGKLAYIGSDEDMQRVYRWAKTHGLWKSLPDSPEPFLRTVKLVTIELPDALAKHPVTVFMQKKEFTAAPYVVGDLVRYSPHDPKYETPTGTADELTLFHHLTGCVATLCRKSDPACFKRYPRGVFTITGGEQVDFKTGKILPDGIKIDPASLLPVQ